MSSSSQSMKKIVAFSLIFSLSAGQSSAFALEGFSNTSLKGPGNKLNSTDDSKGGDDGSYQDNDDRDHHHHLDGGEAGAWP